MVLLCFGTRPEAIKMAPVLYELKRQKLNFRVCVTAQHREMLDQVLGFFEIIPDYDLDLMKQNQNLNLLSADIVSEIDKVFEEICPDIVLVQGDTTTAFIASLAAFNRRIKIGHIEAGLRTGNLKSPFPEEGNRQLISRIADYNFAPTLMAKNNLLKEAVPEEKIIVTGNTIVDALLIAKSKIAVGYLSEKIREFQVLLRKDKKLILVTGHRRENFGKGLEAVCQALLEIAKRDDVQIIFPVHLNPTVEKTVYELLDHNPNINLIKPVNYPSFIWLMMESDLIISDSGGIQEEAPSLKKPVIVTRETTERAEGVEAGFFILTGTSKKKIITEAFRLLDAPMSFSGKQNPFGDGKAAEKVVNFLIGKNV
ncbi:non-hydrolyzing UDP-N-acetylglucosamine 2-epimerase [Salegentibacter lacus]|uniref:non-hydrolyzing UDP-N-acetylglucosamine 2-epimerase n=1 Tax=Salegentibacter lacus TaxID=2873599 RepID=UPI001F0265C9|nr:UDP-N-acetylglucosamine 2-epimerase (non-hydrolyzing) [Salegentibacter lacus]